MAAAEPRFPGDRAANGCSKPVDLMGKGVYSSYTYYFARLSTIKDAQGNSKTEDMIRELVAGQEAVVRTARAVLAAAQKAGDEPTADLVIGRMQLHEKSAWMLRSLLEK